jgi:nicotinamide mononucleotide transporter
MLEGIMAWLIQNWIEILGTIFGILYVILSVKQNILTWLLCFLTSVLYIYVFLDAKFYAGMALQLYYVFVSIYGWITWQKGSKTDEGKEELQVSRLKMHQIYYLVPISLVLWIAIFFILRRFTDSPVPVGDSFMAAFSIVGTWMVAKKNVECWLVWIVVNLISVIIFFSRDLYPTAILYLIYLVSAFWGYYEWKKDLKKQQCLIDK